MYLIAIVSNINDAEYYQGMINILNICRTQLLKFDFLVIIMFLLFFPHSGKAVSAGYKAEA